MPSSQHYKHILWGLSKCESEQEREIHINVTVLFLSLFSNPHQKQAQNKSQSMFFFSFLQKRLQPLLLLFYLSTVVLSVICLYSPPLTEIKMYKLSLVQQQTSVLPTTIGNLSQNTALLSHSMIHENKGLTQTQTLPLGTKFQFCQKNSRWNGGPYVWEEQREQGGRGRGVGGCGEAGASGYSQTGCFGILSLSWQEYWIWQTYLCICTQRNTATCTDTLRQTQPSRLPPAPPPPA